MSLLAQAVIFFAAAAISVPLSKRLGLGSVLGYLVAGAVIGPAGFRLISDVESTMHFAEFGVVLLLFVIGLELQPSRLWQMRRLVFGYGSVQVMASGALLGLAALVLGLSPGAALVTGLGLSLSSTAFALQLLGEKNQLASEMGRTSFGILLFQDLAVIPLLALLPVLAPDASGPQMPMWRMVLQAVLVLAAVGFGGRLVMRPLFRWVAATKSQEVFTATALLIVGGTALLVNQAGLSMALGAFLAGVLLAESEYRHELEADIEPFKGLLLGLFFIAVGMSIRLELLVEKPLQVAGIVVGLLLVKGVVLFALGRWVFRNGGRAYEMALTLSQGGEFAFVLFGLAGGRGLLSQPLGELLDLAVGLSMVATPLLLFVNERWVLPLLRRVEPKEFDVSPDDDHPVIIAGFGRVGQVVGRVLRAKHIPFTAMDSSSEHIEFIKRFGNKVFFGDASRLDLLRAARADKAKVFVLAIDDVEASVRTAETVLQHFPNLTIFARARNRQHAYRLLNLGIENVSRETMGSSVEMTQSVLQDLGFTFSEARKSLEVFREHDERLLMESFKFHKDEKKLRELAANARQELEALFEKDAATRRSA